MLAQLVLVLISGLVFFGFWLGGLALRLDMRRLDQLAKYFEKYNSAMRKILANDVEFPSSVLQALEYWNKAVSEKGFSRNIVFELLRANIDVAKPRSIQNNNEEWKNFFLRYPEIEIEYVAMSLYAVIVSSYRAPLSGLITRSATLELFDEKKPKEVAKFTESVRSRVRVSLGSKAPLLNAAPSHA